MTREHRLILGLDEIRGLRWQCAICATAVSYAMDQTIRLPQRCPGCSAEVPREGAVVKSEQLLIEFIAALKAALREQSYPATLSFEFLDQ